MYQALINQRPAGKAGAASGLPGPDPGRAVELGIMESGITWYDVLGVMPGAEARKIKREYDAKAVLLRPDLIAGAPPEVLSAITRAQELLDTAREVLGDPESRRRYDEAIGLRRSGGGLGPRRPNRGVAVPDVRGLFFQVCLEVAIRRGLHVRIVRLTERPMAVDGLVVDQDPRPPATAHRGDQLTVQLWHPPASPVVLKG